MMNKKIERGPRKDTIRRDKNIIMMEANKKLIERRDSFEVQLTDKLHSICVEHSAPNTATNLRKETFGVLNTTTSYNYTSVQSLPLPQNVQTPELSVTTQKCFKHKSITKNIRKDQETQTTITEKVNRQLELLPETINKLSKNELQRLNTVYSSCELNQLVKYARELSDPVAIANRYEIYRLFCLIVYYNNPLGYELLKKPLSLPNISSMYKHLPMTTDINTFVLSGLETKFDNMLPVEKECIAIVDSMPLTPELTYNYEIDRIMGFHEFDGSQKLNVAERAVVIILSGMFVEWHQPVGYALVNDTISDCFSLMSWVIDLVTNLYRIGLSLRLVNVASKLEADSFEKRLIKINVPYFTIPKRKKTVYYSCESKLMFASLRDEMRTHDIHYSNNRVAKYEFIEQFYLKDKNSEYRLAPKLTDEHVYPTNSDDSTSAIELFSRPVASGISTYISCKQIDELGQDTADLILKLNDLLSLFNLSNASNSKQSHVESLKKMKNIFDHVKVIDSKTKQDKTCSAKFLQKIQININSNLLVFERLELENQAGLPIRIRNQGLTDVFFNKIRSQCSATKPIANQFLTEFKRLLTLNAVKPFKHSNKKSPHHSLLKYPHRKCYRENLLKRLKNSIPHRTQENTPIYRYHLKNNEVTISNSDYCHMDRPERHTLVYMSGYLLNKCKQNHGSCDIFKKYANETSENLTLSHILMDHQCSKHQLSLMSNPCNNFLMIVERLEVAFRKLFRKYTLNSKIEEGLLNEMDPLKSEITLPCPCFPWIFLMKLFIRLKTVYTVRLNSREMVERKQELKGVVIPLLL